MAEKPPIDPRVVGEVLSLFAHDLRNPLAAVTANLGFLEVDPSSEDAEVIDDTMAACGSLRRLISNLELLGRALSGAPQAPRELDVVAALRAAIADVTPAASLSDVTIELRGEPPSAAAYGPPDALARALENLLSNAAAHAPPRSTVSASVRVEGGEIVVDVDDEGAPVGSDPSSLLTPEGQISSHHSGRDRYSRGLGLLCAHLAATSLGGRLEIGAPASGSRLSLVLPAGNGGG